jgi:Na+/H+ antiporter NhaD/arsenite permease-like protein
VPAKLAARLRVLSVGHGRKSDPDDAISAAITAHTSSTSWPRPSPPPPGGSLWVGSMLLLWVSGLLSAIVGNIPYVATMPPVTATLVQDFQGDGDPTVLWWSLALGADLGGTAIGASANVVILGLAQRAGQPISFLEFTKYGAVVAVATMLVCVPYLWLRYFAFG